MSLVELQPELAQTNRLENSEAEKLKQLVYPAVESKSP